MKEQIQQLVKNLEESGSNYNTLIDTLDILLKFQYEKYINESVKELHDVILGLVRETDYIKSEKKFLCYIYIFKFISKHINLSLKELFSEDFLINSFRIKCKIIKDQIHEIIFNVLCKNFSEFDIVINKWRSLFNEVYEDKYEFESLTNLILYICYEMQFDRQINLQFNKIIYKIIQNFSEIYENNGSIFLVDSFVSKLEYSQNLLFPLFLNCDNNREQASKLIENMVKLFESNINMKVFVFTLRIPNLIEYFILNGYIFDYNKFTKSLIQGITSKDSEIRKSTRFILENLETSLIENNLNTLDIIDKHHYLNNIKSFICILDCYENFSIHLLKTNWNKFEKLLSDLQNLEKEWWIDCLIEIGLNHENLNVRRFVAFNTINFAIKNPKNIPSWIKRNTFFNIYLRYIVSLLNNKISLQIEELFLKFIYCVLRAKLEWINEYLEYIIHNIKAFTPIRVLIYPLTVGIRNNLHPFNNAGNISEESNNTKIKSYFHNLNSCNVKTILSKDITQKYSFEDYKDFKESIIIPKKLFTKVLDISIPIIKFVPVVLRREVYFEWLEVILNYFVCNEFSKDELIKNLILFLGIIPEYLFSTKEINAAIYNNIIKYELVIESCFNPETLITISKTWFNVLQLGVGFGRLKQIFGSFSDSTLIMKSHIVFVSSYYNCEEINNLDNKINQKIIEILEKIKILFENSEENNLIDIDLLWLDIHFLSILRNNSYDFYLGKLWDWCILVISDMDTLLTRIKSNINSQISFAMILKCLVYLQRVGKYSSTQKIFDIVNNLLLINNGMLSNMLMNNQNLIIWDKIRRICFFYDIIDTHSVTSDKYCVIQSSALTLGFPESYSSRFNDFIRKNRLVQLFPANYRDLFNLISQLKFQLINIIISKNANEAFSLVRNEIYYYFINFACSTDNFSYTKGSFFDWFKHITEILIYEVENCGLDSFYIWLLIEQLLGFVCVENCHNFEKNFIPELLNTIFELIIKNCDELIENGIYRNNLFTIFISILTKREYTVLFQKYFLLNKVANHFYTSIKLNEGYVRFFIFPLLDLIKNYIESCSKDIFKEAINYSENINLIDSESFNTVIIFANILVELITFEEKGLIDGSKIRFQEYPLENSIGVSEIIDIYRRCKIYEDNSSFVRHATIIYLSNIIEDSMIEKKDSLIKFISMTIILLTKKLEGGIPESVQDKLSADNSGVNKVDSNILNKFLINQADISFKNAKKFPPLPNSNHHKFLINIWQSICCLVNILNLSENQFINYLVGFYFQHLQYLYTPDIRQYIDMLGCNIVTFFPKKCIGYIIEGLSNNINNHTQVIYSYLCISSYLIHFLKDVTPLPFNGNSSTDEISNAFIFEGDLWIKLNEEFMDQYISFFNLFVSYSISNSSLLRNVVLYTIYDAFNNDYVFEILQKPFESHCCSDNIETIGSLAVLFKSVSHIEETNAKIETIRNSKYYVNNKLNTSKKIFLLNLFILEDSKYIRTLVNNIFKNSDILKMLKNVSIVWTIWKPIKYCTVENIIPQDNLVEFFDQKESQNFFNCSSCLDPILCELDGNIHIDEVSFEKELLAIQDKYDTHILNSHLTFGDLRPSWSLYYLLKKIISKEMSGYYVQEGKKEEEEFSAIEIQRSYNYQLKFEPLQYGSPIFGEPRSKKLGNQLLNRTGLIVIGSLVEKVPNIAGITRTCEIFRANELLLSNKKVMNDPIFKQISVTAEKWLPINELEPKKIREYVHNKRMEGYKIFGLEQTSSSIPIKGCVFPAKSVLILGKEKEGIPSDIVSIVA
ncbi:tRNA (Gm18) ribose methylase trm3p superfamily [Cryptosporidium sp. chipmunk genotype I]|uniref:tRNA (Gm18) ribose methylase trm3p superfamily n=1 Tax=Cryptosporidium sp. chipmunk genotype I TaxID=1280935 RepID=UPI00351A3797|nr:tRNA (Gm18) ribose methylase trm3p superfamily [Cryptosporidium sp. chipmunk genotype I]